MNDISSPFNACMFREHCRALEARVRELEAENDRLKAEVLDYMLRLSQYYDEEMEK